MQKDINAQAMSGRSVWLDALDSNEERAETVLPQFSSVSRQEQAGLVRTIGARLREARELCNMTQQEAARRLGYANPSKLAKVEYASDTLSVPLNLISRAALLYDVSIDFLFGAVDDWEPSIERDSTQWLLRAWELARARDLDILGQLHRRVRVVMEAVTGLVEEAGNTSTALHVFAQRNPGFEEMPAGARLVGSVERQAARAMTAERSFHRFRAELTAQASNANDKNPDDRAHAQIRPVENAPIDTQPLTHIHKEYKMLELHKPTAPEIRALNRDRQTRHAALALKRSLQKLVEALHPATVAVIAQKFHPELPVHHAVASVQANVDSQIAEIQQFNRQANDVEGEEKARIKPVFDKAVVRLFEIRNALPCIEGRLVRGGLDRETQLRRLRDAGLPDSKAQVAVPPFDPSPLRAEIDCLKVELEALEKFVRTRDLTVLPTGFADVATDRSADLQSRIAAASEILQFAKMPAETPV